MPVSTVHYWAREEILVPSISAHFLQPIVSVLSDFQADATLAALIQTRLTLVVVVESGHNPVKASGLLFRLPRRHLPEND